MKAVLILAREAYWRRRPVWRFALLRYDVSVGDMVCWQESEERSRLAISQTGHGSRGKLEPDMEAMHPSQSRLPALQVVEVNIGLVREGFPADFWDWFCVRWFCYLDNVEGGFDVCSVE